MAPRLPALTLDELADVLGSAARARAVLRWLHATPTVPAELPARLDGLAVRPWSALRAAAAWTPPVVRERRASVDGTIKYALAFDAALVETVRIPARDRSTVCVSSQAGCTRRCVFCATHTLGFTRQLRADEIVLQVMVAAREAPPEVPVRNVVFMGMGEPMDNLDEVLRAVRVLTQGPAPQLRAQSVTVSTSGVLPGMRRFLRESAASLALSLNATTDELRARLMPHGRVWPIADLLGLLRADAARHPRRECFVEYVLFAGLNDALADADRLVALLDGIGARVNLIPHNPVAGSALRAPSRERVRAFHARIAAHGRRAFVRWPRGLEIAAACGQLAGSTAARAG
ncbi:MAG: 23S rRNA (adenine(2503)-C(2))-methyltransferase RlmN [Deltaproteobacteria bacterium]|nr:23S rRNA (adenine(2503)-C(2))-methyltransferase RlmN [Deltaproteobacteria bacterium]